MCILRRIIYGLDGLCIVVNQEGMGAEIILDCIGDFHNVGTGN
jgi:hypothetical protein